MRKTIYEQAWAVLPLSENVSYRAMVYIESYSLSHGLQMADALIAATDTESGQVLMIANDKYYKVIPELEMNPYRPKLFFNPLLNNLTFKCQVISHFVAT